MRPLAVITDPNPQDDAIDQLVGKVEIICVRVERGRHATDTWHVGAHNAMRVASIIFSALGGAGLVAVNVNPDLPKQHGEYLAGSMLSLIFSILMQLANEFGIAGRAEKARTAAIEFKSLDTNLEIILRQPDPVVLLNELLDKSDDLLRDHDPVLPEPSEAKEQEFDNKAKSRCDFLVRRYRRNWILKSGRKSKGPKTPPTDPAEPLEGGPES
jgi:hypothetical protein